MTLHTVILTALLAATLIPATLAKPPQKSILEVMEQTYEFLQKTKDCEATRNFTLNLYKNAISKERARQIEHNSGFKSGLNYLVNVYQHKLNRGEKILLLLLIATFHAVCFQAGVLAATWIFEKVCPGPGKDKVTITKTQPQEKVNHSQVLIQLCPVPNQQPDNHPDLPGNTEITTQDARPAYENV